MARKTAWPPASETILRTSPVQLDGSRHLQSECGQTLVLSLIVLLVLTISAGAVAQLMTSNASSSSRERQGVQAFSGGEAGLDVAANWVVTNDAGSVKAVNSQQTGSTTVSGNTVNWLATKVSSGQWKVTSTTISPNGKVTKVLQEQLQSTQVPGSPATFWGYGLVLGGQQALGGYTPYQICESGLGPDKPTVFGGSGTVNVPLWVAGDVCTSGGNSPIQNPTSGSPITVHIGGFIYGSNGPSYIVGAPGNNVANFEAIGGCYDKHTNSGQLPIACDVGGNATSSGNSGIYSSGFTASTQVVTPPTFTAQQELNQYSLADPGPSHPCTPALSAGTPPANLFDGNATLDTSLGTQNLITYLGTNAFVCRTANGTFAWTPPTSHGAKACLHVTGNAGVFLDGNFTMGGADYIQFDTDGTNACGTGTAANPNSYTDGPTDGSIYIDGTLTLTNDASICSRQDFNAAGTTCTIPTASGAAHFPSVFWSIYNRANTVPAFSMPGNSKFESSAYVRGQYSLTNGGSASSVGGSIFADYASITGGSSFAVTNVVPDGSIGSATTTTAWNVAPRTWRQCPVSGCS